MSGPIIRQAPSYVITVQALSACGAKMASAPDGRGIRGAREEAARRLVRAGHDQADAARMVGAMQAVALTIRHAIEREAIRQAGPSPKPAPVARRWPFAVADDMGALSPTGQP
jgi:hypothetical protein